MIEQMQAEPTRSGGRTSRPRHGLTLVVAVVLVAVTACSSSGSPKTSGTTTTSTSAASTTTTSAAATTTTGGAAPTTTAAAATTSTTAPAGATTSTTTAAAQPVLGRVWGPPSQKGYGQVQPAEISNGGDPTGIVTGVTWTSWGSAQAIGHGTSDYVAPGQSNASGTQATATVVAFDLGDCNGVHAYKAIEWYYPQHGQSFRPNDYINICTGAYVGSP